MAKLAVVNRDLKRRKIVQQYLSKRTIIMKILNDPKSTEEEKTLARYNLQRLPRDSSPVRLRNRCSLTGRPRGVYSKFGLGRCKLRDIAMSGNIPGITKASW